MKFLRTLAVLLPLMLGAGLLSAQNYQTNFTIQLGGQARYFNPKPINFAIDSLFNTVNPNAKQALDPVKWTLGLSGGIGYHKGRANLRLLGSTYSYTSTALFSEAGQSLRRDLRFSGYAATFTLTSELIRASDYFGFYVGGGLSATNFQLSSLEMAEADFDENATFEQLSNEWKVAFIIQTPFRIGIGPQVKISLEPFYQVFFSPINAADAGEVLFGGPGPVDKLKGSVDHVGFTGAVIVYLRRN